MECIKFLDTEGRNVELQKPLFSWEGWNVRINDEVYAGITKGEDGGWHGVSTRLDSSDLDALVWIVENYEANRGK